MTKSNRLARTGYLTSIFLRRDRFAIAGWLLGIVGGVAAGASKILGLSGSSKQITALVTALDTPSMAALFGPISKAHAHTSGAVFAASMVVFISLLMAIMNIFFAIRNTRAQEDNGVLEMVQAHSVGRQSSLLATVYELLLVNGLTIILVGMTLQSFQMSGTSVLGDWLFAIGTGLFGALFGTFALLLSQFASNARGATMMSYGLLGLLYIARAMTDVSNVKLNWWTVFGWVEKIDIYGQNRLAPIWNMPGLAVIILVVTFVISAKRDIGSGILSDRRGRARASQLLAGPIALVFRLERSSMIAWIVGLGIYGLSMGTLFDTVGDMMKNSPMVSKMLGPAAADAVGRTSTLQFAAMMSVIIGIGASVPAIATMLRLNRDEQKGWLESIHARSTSRFHLFISYTIVSVVAGLLTLFAGTFGMALGSQSAKRTFEISRIMRSFWSFTPAVLVVIGVVAVLIGLIGRYQQVAWVIPIYAVVSIYLGGLLNFPAWTRKLTPFGWIAKVPLKTVQWGQVSELVGLSLGLILVGYLLYKRRDLVEN